MKKILLGIVIFLLLGGIGYLEAFLQFQAKDMYREDAAFISDKPVSNILKPLIPDETLPQYQKVINNIVTEKGNTTEKISTLLGAYTAGDNDAGRTASVLYALKGDYIRSKKILDQVCEKDPSLCKKGTLKITLENTSSDPRNTGYTTTVLGENAQITKNSDMPVLSDMVYRIKSSKKGFSDDFLTVNYFSEIDGEHLDVQVDPRTFEADKTVTTNSDAPFEMMSKGFTIRGSGGNFGHEDGTPVQGKIDIFFFAITAQDLFYANSGLVNLTALGVNGDIAGSYMLSYGMPIVKAYSGDKELKIIKPISGFSYMVDSNDQKFTIPEQAPKNTWINQEMAEKLGMPPFWNLDKNAGVWRAGEYRILDDEGYTEFLLK